MPRLGFTIKKVIVAGYLIILHAAVVLFLIDRFVMPKPADAPISRDMIRDPARMPQVDPTLLPSETPSPMPEPSVSEIPVPVQTTTPATQDSVLIPVQGIAPAQLQDTYSDARSDGRTHNAIDIMAPAGTPVVAAVDGEIIKFHDSVPGGITIYQITPDRRFFFYYAHLQRRAEGIAEKQFVTRGTTIGYVGDTGNSGAGNFHLHFSISIVKHPTRFWDGESINPYPILTGASKLP